MIKIESSLVNSNIMRFTKETLIDVSEVDHKEDFRVEMLEYINDIADNNDDEFFYNYVRYVRFVHDNDERCQVACTAPNKFIYMKSPGKIGEDVRLWDFIYCHECMHQLWDTFEVGEQLKKEGIYNHYLLNIASDCIINDYLSRIRKKPMPDDLVTPKLLKEKYGVEYDNTKDIQYTLYLKLLEKKDEIEKDEELKKSLERFNGKIKPKSVTKIKDDDGNGDESPHSQKHSDDYIKGWTTAIKDVLDKKFDPLKDSVKKTGNDEYDKGYKDAIENIKNGLENGIEIAEPEKSKKTGQSDLPSIPWDMMDTDLNDGSDGDDNEGDDSNNSSSDDKDKKESDKKDSNGKDKNDKKSDKKDSDGNGSDGKESKEDIKKEAEKAANSAKEAAEKAKESAKEAKEAANGKDVSKSEIAKLAEKAADISKEAAEEANKEMNKAKEAADNGNLKEAEKHKNLAKKAADKAKRAEAQAKSWSTNLKSKSDNSVELGDEQEESERAKKYIEKMKQKISGPFGEFLKRCRLSRQLAPDGLETGVRKGVSTWSQKMEEQADQWVKNAVFQKSRQYKKTYQRHNRRAGIVKFGEPLNPGKKVIDDKLLINVAFYLDTSGSMTSCYKNVFKAAYDIAKSLKEKYGKNRYVDDTLFRMFTFDTKIQEIKFGTVKFSGGENIEFGDLLDDIESRTSDYLINIIITDGYYEIDEKNTTKSLEKFEGCVIYIVNNSQEDVKAIADKQRKSTKGKNNLFYIQADENFTL